MAQPLFKLRSAHLEDIIAGKPITKEQARIVFNQKTSDLLFQDVERSSVYIPPECIAKLEASTPKQSLQSINAIREFNRLPPATMPEPVTRNLNRHQWISKLGGKCAGCPNLGLQYCQKCGRIVCNNHKRMTECPQG